MELKNMMPRNFKKLLWHNLKEKKNWFLLSLVILVVTVVVVPLLMERDLGVGNIMVGIFEVFIIIFINCIIDFSYLHDTRKYGYYLSKPLTNIQKINVIIVANIIFAMVLMFSLWAVSLSQGFDLNELFVVPVPWLLIGIFVAALSSVLAGNSVIGGVATIFNFALPVSILGVIYFALEIVENMALGFDSGMLMEKFIEKFYKIDYLYFFKFVNEQNWLSYFAILISVCVVVYLITIKLLNRRKNERIGQLVIFTGYKNFVALLVATLIPFSFTSALSSNDYIAKLLSFVILGSIAYYVTIAILEKSFKLEKKAFRLLGVFMASFVVFVLCTGMVTKAFESYIPDIEDVEGAIILGYDRVYIKELDDYSDISDLVLSSDKYDEINIFTSEEAINAIRSLQEAVIENQEYHYFTEINIVYFLKDGDTINRWYRLERVYDYDEEREKEVINPNLDAAALKLEQTDEYKMKVLKFIYDDDFTREWVNTKISVSFMFDEVIDLTLDNNGLSGLRQAFRKDIEVLIDEEYNSFATILTQTFEGYTYERYDIRMADPYDAKREVANVNNLRFNLRIKSGSGYDKDLNIPPGFINTRDFIKWIINQ